MLKYIVAIPKRDTDVRVYIGRRRGQGRLQQVSLNDRDSALCWAVLTEFSTP